jgi:hypothetical protein
MHILGSFRLCLKHLCPPFVLCLFDDLAGAVFHAEDFIDDVTTHVVLLP